MPSTTETPLSTTAVRVVEPTPHVKDYVDLHSSQVDLVVQRDGKTGAPVVSFDIDPGDPITVEHWRELNAKVEAAFRFFEAT